MTMTDRPAERRGLGRGLGELFQRTEPSAPAPVREAVDDGFESGAIAGPNAGSSSAPTRARPRSRTARTSPRSRSTRSPRTLGSPGPSSTRTPWPSSSTRSREVGLLQPDRGPTAGRRIAFELVDGRAALAGRRSRPGWTAIPAIVRETDESRPAARRAAGEPAPRPAQPAGGGGGVPADAGGLRLHAGGAGQPDQAIASADLQHHPACCGCRRPSSGGWRPGCSRPGTRGPFWRYPTRAARSGWHSASWPRGCRCGPPRRSSPSGMPRSRLPRPDRRDRRASRIRGPARSRGQLADRLDTRVKVDSGRTKGRLTIEFASAEDLERDRRPPAPAASIALSINRLINKVR